MTYFLCVNVIPINFVFLPKKLTVQAGKIIGGKMVVPHSRPYMVLLERTDEREEIKYCGGFLITEDFMMTAAHCQAKSV